ncbi:hypothetical protein MAHJHV55_51690 [Mycobacterium avium subsp. hominissuis]
MKNRPRSGFAAGLSLGGSGRTALTRVLRAIIGPDTEAGPMIARNTLVSAVRA